MYCPRCASPAVEGQRFCRNCGINLGLIVDAMQGRRGPLDLEALKEELLQLGKSLRSGFEEAREGFKKTQRFSYPFPQRASAPPIIARDQELERALEKLKQATRKLDAARRKLQKGRAPDSRRYHFQQATLAIFSGGAMSATLYYFLNIAAHSGLLESLEQIILRQEPGLVGVTPLLQSLWVLGLLPVARGVAHLINGIFFPPKPAPEGEAEVEEIEERIPQPVFAKEEIRAPAPETSISTNELEPDRNVTFRPSVTEDPTLHFAPRKTE